MVNNSYFFQRGRAFGPASFLIILFLALSCSRADLPENDYVKYQLISPAVGYHVYSYNCKAQMGSNFSVTFNKDGKVDQLQHFFPDGTPGTSEVYHYAKGRLEDIYTYDRDGDDNGFYQYEYDGEIISTCTLYGKNTEVVFKWEHGNDGRRITKTRSYHEDILDNISESEFHGNKREEKVSDAEGREYLHNTYVYYDLTNQLISSFSNEELSFSIEYNDKGLPCSSTDILLDATGGLYALEGHEHYEITYEYDYDSHGNWTERRQILDGALLETLKRDIGY